MEVGSIRMGGALPIPNMDRGMGDQPIKAEMQPEVIKSKREDAEKAVEELNKVLNYEATHLKFTIHEKLGDYYVQIIDNQTNEVVREIPSKKILDMVAQIQEKLGILVDLKR
jgi:flagellar protein FlaG